MRKQRLLKITLKRFLVALTVFCSMPMIGIFLDTMPRVNTNIGQFLQLVLLFQSLFVLFLSGMYVSYCLLVSLFEFVFDQDLYVTRVMPRKSYNIEKEDDGTVPSISEHNVPRQQPFCPTTGITYHS